MIFFDQAVKTKTSKRSSGVLSADQIRSLRQAGVPLAYDPVQIGWVREDSLDDMSDLQRWNGLANPADINLRPWSPDDAASLAFMLSDAALWTFLPDTYPGIISPRQGRNLIEVANYANHHIVRAIVKNGLPVGQVRLEFDKDDSGQCELSYWIGKNHRGDGIASKAIALLLDETRHLNLKTLFAMVHQDNAASRRVVTKLGFSQTSQDGVWIRLEKALRPD